MTQVVKFGGTSVGSPEAIRTAVELVRSTGARVVVVSAMNGVTDLLLTIARLARQNRLPDVTRDATFFQNSHRELARQLIQSIPTLESIERLIDEFTHELLAMSESIAILKELTPRTQDAVVARGERLLARIFTEVLGERGTTAKYVDATELIVAHRRDGAVWPDLAACEDAARHILLPLLNNGVTVVVPGYIGSGPEGEVITLGRGGSDFSAAILARSVSAEGLTLYKEVDGLMTADPKCVPDARVLPELHYREAAELAFYGARILHPRTMIPLREKKIPLQIRNTFNPSFSGTRIGGDVTPGAYPVKALTAIDDQALVSIEGGGMVGVPGIAARTFTALSQAGHSVSMISQASSEASICMVVPESEAGDSVSALSKAFEVELRNKLIDSIKAERGISLVAVVGLGMSGTPAIAGRVFGALGREKINVVAIAQGSSELNITVAIKREDVPRALNALHREFQLSKIRPLADTHGRDSIVAFLGFGRIGRELARQIISQDRYFRYDLGLTLRCVAVSDRSGLQVREEGFSNEELLGMVTRKEAAPSGSGPRSMDAIAADLRRKLWVLPAANPMLVDVTAEDTAPILRQAVDHGFHIVLANKKPLTIPQGEFDELMESLRSRGLSLRYEATVGAGLPVLDTLGKLKEAGDQVETVTGCLSGTLGYLMTQLEEGTAFSEAVHRAFTLGYTEPDPREDLSGMDVARKALILARTLGYRLNLQDVAVEALFPAELSDDNAENFLRNLKQLDGSMQDRIAAARAEGKVLRYVARIGGERVTVGIEAVPVASPMGRLRGTDNQVVLQTRRYKSNPMVVIGPGAGAEVTAAGVLNDILSIATNLERRHAPQAALR